MAHRRQYAGAAAAMSDTQFAERRDLWTDPAGGTGIGANGHCCTAAVRDSSRKASMRAGDHAQTFPTLARVSTTGCPSTLTRKNGLFAGHNAGAENEAVIAALIGPCKINAIDPQA
jgi:hypothetical protein